MPNIPLTDGEQELLLSPEFRAALHDDQLADEIATSLGTTESNAKYTPLGPASFSDDSVESIISALQEVAAAHHDAAVPEGLIGKFRAPA
jgi:hypothetical protein